MRRCTTTPCWTRRIGRPGSSCARSPRPPRRRAPTSVTCPATGRRSTTRTCSPRRCWHGYRRRRATARWRRRRRRGFEYALGTPAPGRIVAIRRARRPGLGGQLPYRLRARLAAILHRRRNRRAGGRTRMAPRRRVLPAQALPRRRDSEVLRHAGPPDRWPLGGSGHPDAFDRRTPRPQRVPRHPGGCSSSPAGACCGGDGLPIFQKRRLWTNGALHVRWSIAPMLLALTHLIRVEAATRSEAKATSKFQEAIA